MPEESDFGDIDDAQLEAAMAALLGPSSSAAPEPQTPPLEADAFDFDVAGDQEVDVASAPELDVSLWAPAAPEVSADLALEDAGFASPLHTALGDLASLNSDTFSSPPPAADHPQPAPGPPAPASRSRLAPSGSLWSNHKRELVPGLIVALLVVLGLAAVIASMTNDDGGRGRSVSASGPTSTVPTTTTTMSIDTVPPPPPPVPIEVAAPSTPAVATGTGLVPKRFRAPAKKAAPASSPKAAAPVATPSGGNGGPGPMSPPEPPTSPPPPSTAPPTTPPSTSPPTTTPPTTSPPTTQPHDRCDGLTGVALERCLIATGG